VSHNYPNTQYWFSCFIINQLTGEGKSITFVNMILLNCSTNFLPAVFKVKHVKLHTLPETGGPRYFHYDEYLNFRSAFHARRI